MLIPAAGIFALLGWVLNKIIVSETDDSQNSYLKDNPSENLTETIATSPPIIHWKKHNPHPATTIFAGSFSGMAITCLVGLTYWMLLGIFRPSVLPQAISSTSAAP